LKSNFGIATVSRFNPHTPVDCLPKLTFFNGQTGRSSKNFMRAYGNEGPHNTGSSIVFILIQMDE
jgi:hypothetical protein